MMVRRLRTVAVATPTWRGARPGVPVARVRRPRLPARPERHGVFARRHAARRLSRPKGADSLLGQRRAGLLLRHGRDVPDVSQARAGPQRPGRRRGTWARPTGSGRVGSGLTHAPRSSSWAAAGTARWADDCQLRPRTRCPSRAEYGGRVPAIRSVKAEDAVARRRRTTTDRCNSATHPGCNLEMHCARHDTSGARLAPGMRRHAP